MRSCGRMLAAACVVALLSSAGAAAHCSAKDAHDRLVAAKHQIAATVVRAPIRSAAEAPIWKTITVGTFRDSLAMRNTLDALDCGVGDGAAQILARPSFGLAARRGQLDLVTVTAAQLGFQAEAVRLDELHARAEHLGLGLAPAEAGPQLRLQYADQPTGEFLILGMRPLRTWSGEALVFVVANGGAGLHLLSQDAHAPVHARSHILFVRGRHDADVALGE